MARKLTEQERENVEALRVVLNEALPPAQRGIASGIASALVRTPGDTVTDEDLTRIVGKYEEADESVARVVRETLLDPVEGQEGVYTVRVPETPAQEGSEEASRTEDAAASEPGDDGETASEGDAPQAEPPAPDAPADSAVPDEQPAADEAVGPAGEAPTSSEETGTNVADAEADGVPAPEGADAPQDGGEAPAAEGEPAAPKPQRRARRARRTHKTADKAADADKTKAADADKAEGEKAQAEDKPAGKPAKSSKADKQEKDDKASGKGKAGGQRRRKEGSASGKDKDAPAQGAAGAGTGSAKVPRKPDDEARDLRKVPYVRRGGDTEAEIRQKIVSLDKRFWMNGWLLSHPGAYTLYERELLAINDALSDGMLPGDITRRQLAYQMGGDEKFFEYGSNGFRLLRAMGMEDVIRHRPVPKPDLVYHAPRRRKHMRVLVTENLDPYLDVHDLMYEDGRTTILGERIHAVVLGGGTPVLEHNRLALLLDTLGADTITVLYWGDIDRAGLEIMVKLKDVLGDRYRFRAFTPAYQLMVDRAMERFPDPEDNESTGQINIEMCDTSLLCDGLTDEAADYARAVIENCGLIPQEILTKRDL